MNRQSASTSGQLCQKIAGVEKRDHQEIDGVSLLSVLKNPEATLERDAIYFHFPHYHHDRPAGSIRKGKWKLIEYFENGRLELYDLQRDLSEERNLLANDASSEHEQLAHSMQKQLEAWRKEVNAQMPTPNPDHDPNRELDIVRKRRR